MQKQANHKYTYIDEMILGLLGAEQFAKELYVSYVRMGGLTDNHKRLCKLLEERNLHPEIRKELLKTMKQIQRFVKAIETECTVDITGNVGK